MAENEQMRSTVETVTSENQNLIQRQENMEQIIATGQVLQTAGISATAIRLKSSGKQVDTDRASRTEMIKTCFTLIENRIAKKGIKNLYLKIVAPNGQVLQAPDGGGQADLGGEMQNFSIQRDIDYNNQEMDVCVFYSMQGEAEKGDYKIFLYDGSTQIATTDLGLK